LKSDNKASATCVVTMFTQIDALHRRRNKMTAYSNAQRHDSRMCAYVILACIDKDAKAVLSYWILENCMTADGAHARRVYHDFQYTADIVHEKKSSYASVARDLRHI